MEAAKLLSPWPSAAGRLQGPLGLQIDGKLGRTWQGTAEARLQGGKVLGAEVSEWRLPVTWAFAPETGRVRVKTSETSVYLGGGRATGSATLTVDGAVQLQGKMQFTNVDLGPVLGGHVDGAPLGGGKVSGKVEFVSEDLRSASNLTGQLDATLEQTKSLDLPVFKQVLALVGVAPSETFRRGTVRARLAGEVVRIERLSLDSSLVQLYATGTVTTQGRLGLDVTANTGRAGLTVGLLRQLGVPVMGELGPRPLAVLRQLFAVRLLHMHVTGTVRQPTIQVQPLPLLGQEPLRYFLDGIAGRR